ncbi:MAG TPA: hypothetical protein ENN88_01005, partial [Candidatus Coatesbacteria bacterium]|nr:hypothetical protein [Candidatus Coatesbacteria bacterium]
MKKSDGRLQFRNVVAGCLFSAMTLVLAGCASPTGVEGGSMWWPQAIGWSWLYLATDQGNLEVEAKIEETEEHGDRECFVNEFGDYASREGMLVAVHPASDEAFEIWDQRFWVEVGGLWLEAELRYSDPLTAHISGTLGEPVSDTGEGVAYVGGFPIGGFTASLTSETLETGVELEVQGRSYTDLRRVKFTLESDVQEPATSAGYFGRGVG